MKVFLDIAVGDMAKYTMEMAEYNRAMQFLAEKGSSSCSLALGGVETLFFWLGQKKSLLGHPH